MSLQEIVEFEDNGKRYRIARDKLYWRKDDSIFPVPCTKYRIMWAPSESNLLGFAAIARDARIKRFDKKDMKILIWQIKMQAKRKAAKWFKKLKAKLLPDN